MNDQQLDMIISNQLRHTITIMAVHLLGTMMGRSAVVIQGWFTLQAQKSPLSGL